MFLTYRFMHHAFLSPLDKAASEDMSFLVTPEKTLYELAQELAERGVIRYPQSLRIIAKLRGASFDLQPGEYLFSAGLSPREIFEKLQSGARHLRSFDFLAGETMWELAKRLEEVGILEAEKIEVSLSDPQLLARAGISAPSFEGYLFPGTYEFSRGTSPEKIIWTLLESGDANWPAEFSQKASELRLSRQEVLALASLIQKESLNESEMPSMSAVFHNRLSQGIKLQVESALRYGLRDPAETLSPEDLTAPSPFNTFLNFGLPPSPICNPGLAAIRAALFPEDSKALFYLDNQNGGHVFLDSQSEYNQMLQVLAQKPKEELVETGEAEGQ
jgi:UPF0755 protein